MKLAFYIISFIIAATIVSIIFITRAINKKYEDFVLLNSTAIKNLRSINSAFKFESIPPILLEHSYDNENFYDDISPKDYLTYQLVYIQKDVKKSIAAADENRRNYSIYENRINRECFFNQYDTEVTLKNKNKLAELEKKIFASLKKQPVIYFSIAVRLILTNINGRRLGHKGDIFNTQQIEEIISHLNQKHDGFYLNDSIWQSICRVERGKVSNRMRFAIYKRDGNRCRKCGRSTGDLEVDHIYPIAKGGKSTFDNLQTLCHRCNTLKADTVERGAVNPRSRQQSKSIECPQCGATLVFKKGKYGNFYGCPNYPKCKFTQKA